MKKILLVLIVLCGISAQAQTSGYFLAGNNWSNDTIYYKVSGQTVGLWGELACSNASPSTTLCPNPPAIIAPLSGAPGPNSVKGRRLPSASFYDMEKGNVIPLYLNINGYPGSPLNFSFYSRVSNKLSVGDKVLFSVTYLK